MTDNPRENRASIFGLTFRQTDAAFMCLALFFLYLHLFILPATPIYYEMDHVAALNDAKRMAEGEQIYRDFFEFVFPGIEVLYLSFFKIFGFKYWIANALIIGHGLASTALCLAFARRIIGRSIYSYLPAAVYLFAGFRWFGIDGEHRMFSPVFASLAVLVILKRRSVGRIAAAGVLCALSSFFTQQRGILALGAIGLFVIYELGFPDRRWARMIAAVTTLGAAFAVSLGLMMLPFILSAGPATIYDCTIAFLSNYVQDPKTNSIESYLYTLEKVRNSGFLITAITLFYYLLIPLVYLATAVALWLKRNALEGDEFRAVVLLCLLGAFLSVGTVAPNAGRLFQIAVPAVVLFGWLIYRFLPRNEGFAKAAVVALILFGTFQAIRIQTAWDATILDTPSGDLVFFSPVVLERYAWLKERTNPGDYVYETYNAHVNFPLGLRNPSYISVALNTGYTTPDQVKRIINDLKTRRPRYIIWDGAWTPEMETLRDDERLKPLYVYMTRNYELHRRFSAFDGREPEIWEIAGERPGVDVP